MRLPRELNPEWFWWQRLSVSLAKAAVCVALGLLFGGAVMATQLYSGTWVMVLDLTVAAAVFVGALYLVRSWWPCD